MSQDERWMGPVLRHGVEARLDGRNSDTRVMVFLAEDESVQWGPTGQGAVRDEQPHSFYFWVHANTDSERLDAIQILGRKLLEAGHAWDVIPVPPGGQPEATRERPPSLTPTSADHTQQDDAASGRADGMRLAIVAPLTEPIPPPLYGGTERVVSLLTEELVRRGHDVTLFASADSQTAATLVACSPTGLRLDASISDYVAYAMTELAEVSRRAAELEVIHNHIDYLAFLTARVMGTPTVTTTHGRLDLVEVRRVYDAFPEQPLVAISDDQRSYLPTANWIGTVYNAVDVDHYQFRPEPGEYLVFLGRISPEKRPDRAIEIARDAGMRLIMAAKVDPVDQDYWDHAIQPLVDANPGVIEFIGEVDEAGKNELLGGAWAYLFPIDWPEPFGLTMAEAMATGTPVVAYRAGSVPEVIEHGVTGFVCDTLTEMVAAVGRVGELDRAACRARVERLFSPAAMTDGYEQVYAALLAT